MSGRKDIESLFRSGKRLSGDRLTIIYRVVPGEGRWSVFVPRRLGGPVRRNRARRALSEFVRTHPHQALAGKDLIFLLKKSTDKESVEKAKEEALLLLGRMNKDNRCSPG